MLILIDDADVTKIEELYAKYPYDGVTTNPTILSKTGNPNPMDQLKKIRSVIPKDAMLHAQVLSVTATAVYSVMPAFMAAKAGAEFLAPYVNRLDNLGYDGAQIAKDIHVMVKEAGYEAKVLGASFKNSQQIVELAKAGIGSVTVNPDTLETLTYHGVTETAVQDFIQDFEKCCGYGKTMLDF